MNSQLTQESHEPTHTVIMQVLKSTYYCIVGLREKDENAKSKFQNVQEKKKKKNVCIYKFQELAFLLQSQQVLFVFFFSKRQLNLHANV